MHCVRCLTTAKFRSVDPIGLEEREKVTSDCGLVGG